MPALLSAYYTNNYAGIFDAGLATTSLVNQTLFPRRVLSLAV